MALFKKSQTLASPKLRRKRRRWFEIKIGIAVVGVLALVFGLSALSKLSAFSVQKIDAKGNSIITAADIQAIADKDLDGTYFYLFSKRNSLLYPKKKIQRDIAAAFPILTSVEVRLKDFMTLEVDSAERSPKALWCSYDASAADPFTDSCYLMDKSGYIYLPAPEFKGSPYIKYYGGVTGAPIGSSFMPALLPKLADFIEGVRSLSLTPIFLYAEDNGDMELHLDGGGKILLTRDSDLSETLINLDTILQDNISLPSKRDAEINYIDLRYGNRVFFKLNGGKVSSASSTQSR